MSWKLCVVWSPLKMWMFHGIEWRFHGYAVFLVSVILWYLYVFVLSVLCCWHLVFTLLFINFLLIKIFDNNNMNWFQAWQFLPHPFEKAWPQKKKKKICPMASLWCDKSWSQLLKMHQNVSAGEKGRVGNVCWAISYFAKCFLKLSTVGKGF